MASVGGGIHISSTGQTVLKKLTLYNNSSSGEGGGIYVGEYTNVTIEACKIYNNESVSNGGGIYSMSDSTIIQNSLIYKNSTQLDGGGIHTGGKLMLINSTVALNTIPNGRNGGGMTVSSGLDSILILNNIFYGNYNDLLGIYLINGKIVAYNNYLQSANSSMAFSRGADNIYTDENPFIDASNNNYQLIKTSDAIGSGLTKIGFYGTEIKEDTLDILQANRPQPKGSNPDLGAYEHELGVRMGKKYNVVADGSGDYQTIQSAIDISKNRDSILVFPGYYSENIDFQGKSIIVLSNSGPDSTTIDGNEDGTVVYINDGELDLTTIKGFTIQNGNGKSVSGQKYGGGIFVESGAFVSIKENIIKNNSGLGGGIYISDNTSTMISNCLIVDNSNALEIGNSSNTSIINSTISGNENNSKVNGTINFINTIVWDKEIQSGASGLTVNLYNNILKNGQNIFKLNQNDLIVYDDSNISDDPIFRDTTAHNYRLQNHSPGIGGGIDTVTINNTKFYTPQNDIHGKLRPSPDKTSPDIGAYESIYGTQGPIPGIVYDGIISDTSFWSNSISSLSSFWTGFTSKYGISHYQYAIGSITSEIDSLVAWTDVAAGDSAVTVDGLSLTESAKYQFGVRAKDINGVISEFVKSPGVTIDTTKPIISDIVVGSNSDLDWLSKGTVPVHWTMRDNGEIYFNEYSIGDVVGEDNIVKWTSNQIDTSASINPSDFIENKQLFLNVRATDKAKNISSIYSGDGFKVDRTSPKSGSVFDGLGKIDINMSSNLDSVGLSWDGFEDEYSGIENYMISVGFSIKGTDLIDYDSVGNVNEYSFKVSSQLEHAKKIYSSVVAIDVAGNYSDTVSSDGFVVDHYEGPPFITSISPSPGNIPFRNIGSFDLTLSEPINDVSISGTGKYTGDIDLTINFPESNKIQLQVNQILASNDSIHFLITGLSDLAFNVAKDSSFVYLTHILGDYNYDGFVNVQDLSVFASNWNDKSYNFELGPVSGTLPHFLIIPDQKFDLRDVMSFTRMWHWSRKSTPAGRILVNSGEVPKFDFKNNVLTIILPPSIQTGSIELTFNPVNISISGNMESANTNT
ncbi:MAG: right-handed parallel beta-helix repeat-containing protein, partial [Candidatus Neomarinimicrobiota bacterium]|nr:right-handed parallel beta-helix repeat-containing protein [Candidatus Neomarinimicrobiota bacterium]